MDRVFERAFAKAYGGQLQAESQSSRKRALPAAAADGPDADAKNKVDPTAPSAIQVILDAWKKKDYFR